MKKIVVTISVIILIVVCGVIIKTPEPEPNHVYEWSHTYCEPHYTGDGF